MKTRRFVDRLMHTFEARGWIDYRTINGRRMVRLTAAGRKVAAYDGTKDGIDEALIRLAGAALTPPRKDEPAAVLEAFKAGIIDKPEARRALGYPRRRQPAQLRRARKRKAG